MAGKTLDDLWEKMHEIHTDLRVFESNFENHIINKNIHHEKPCKNLDRHLQTCKNIGITFFVILIGALGTVVWYNITK